VAAVAFVAFWLFAAPIYDMIDPSKSEGEDCAPAKAGTICLAASFNPPHAGHFAILQQLSTMYTEVVAIVAYNPSKTYPVSAKQRAEIMKAFVKDIGADNIRVEIVTGYIWRWCAKNNVRWVARGIRSFAKDGVDEKILEIQNLIAPVAVWLSFRLSFDV